MDRGLYRARHGPVFKGVATGRAGIGRILREFLAAILCFSRDSLTPLLAEVTPVP
jgi:hypothetical protein